LERSLVIIKPDGTVRRTIGALVVRALLDRGYSLCAFKEMKVSKELAEMHYDVHREKPFFPWLVEFITSARVLVMIFEGPSVIEGIREALGATFVQKASPETLRGKYGLYGGINIAHASDAPETAAKEIRLWTEKGGVIEAPSAQSEAIRYIESYTRNGVDYTAEIRQLITTAIQNNDKSTAVLQSLEDWLSKDARNIETQEVHALASAIFSLIREEIDKKE